MPSFYQLLLSIVGHVSPRSSRMTHAASFAASPRKRPKRGRKGQAPPPLFQGDNRLRRDIGLPPLDRHGLPM